jgi:hypothetical protein
MSGQDVTLPLSQVDTLSFAGHERLAAGAGVPLEGEGVRRVEGEDETGHR